MNEATTRTGLRIRMLLISTLTSVLWLHSICLFQNIFWVGGDHGGHDYGLVTLVPAWLLSIFWSRILCFSAAKKFLGRVSVAGFVIGGLFSIPGILLGLMFSPLILNILPGRIARGIWTFFEKGFELIFKTITLNGLIPEGRPGTAGMLGLFWMGILLATYFGLAWTHREDRLS